ncbi:MAG TPA: glycosyltransferase [Cyclobacteriaceae bacterium]|nr:glycosyltransferase [Cyclobacteriaceae bacterium]
MKVLMFGWEFPPHISGGLGIACFGLIRSLTKEKTQVLFVMPKASGDETGDATIINASDVGVPIKVGKKNDQPDRVKSKSQNGLRQETSIARTISSPLSLYPTSPFEVNCPENPAENDGRDSFNDTILEIRHERNGLRYSFSGVYGPNLPEEVIRYAEVAGEIAKRCSFDVIHAHDWVTFPAGIAAKNVSQKPLVVHIHATEYDRAGENIDPHVYLIEREGMEHANRVIAVSHRTKNILVTRYGIQEDKITVIHNGVLTNRDSSTMSASPFGKKVVTFLGRITHQKGPKYFIDAAAKVLEKFPNAQFAMAGTGDLLPRMIERAAQLRISSHFHFAGFLNEADVDRLWAISELYVMPSVSEPFGIAALEAIQAGVPVIISNQSGVGEVMPHAIKIDSWDVGELANAITTVLNYKSLTKTLKKEGRRQVKQLTWRNAAKKVNTIYHELQTRAAIS